MMAKPKPYTEAQLLIFYQLATVMVCSEIESQVIAPFSEKEAGKPYDRSSPDSFTNTFLNKNPEFRRAFETLGVAIGEARKNQLQLVKAARSKHGS
ncbi:TPA: hypothetical protein ACF1LI_004445 [Klebsiella pneumoniae]|uniref:hypothetical protein n=1 Tax=Klebsiella variicola TaxID=244366 RepID=UPI001034EAF1|nr:hypothetical protein [Klebsiella variicola]